MKKWYTHPLILSVSLLSLALACGNGNKNEDAETETESSGDIVPCELLTVKQVETVLPGTDEGFTASSGGSLMKGVDSYQCSYSDEAYNLFTVIVHVAATKDDFDWIKPRESIGDDYKDAHKLTSGDGGWLYGSPDDMKVEVVKGYKVLELHLISPFAGEKGDALVELAKILINKI
jgi:hypothetical protein